MSSTPRREALVLGAVLGGALAGGADALRVELVGLLLPSTGRTLLLLACDAAVTGLVAALAVALVALLPSPWRGRLLGRHGAWAGGVLGVLVALWLDLGEIWLRDPAPFSEVATCRNGPLALAMLVLLAPLALVLARAAHPALRLLIFAALPGFQATRIIMTAPELPAQTVAPAEAPAVLLVSLDTTRADHFGAYGATSVRTPTFDRLAREGVLVELAVAPAPVTGPSHTTILSGQGPWLHGNLLNGLPLPSDLPLLQGLMRGQGWRTGAFVSAYVLDGDLGFSQGFEVYDDDFGWFQGWGDTAPGRLGAMLRRHRDPHEVLERLGGRTVSQALRWLEAPEARSQPSLAWVHLFDPHGPYEPPPPWDTAYYEGDPYDPANRSMEQIEGVAPYLLPTLHGVTDVEWVKAQYKGEISYVDEQLARLVAWAEARERPTLVVVVGDHGESLGEHGSWFNHGDDLYEPSTRVPLVFWQPGQLPGGAVIDAPVELGDIAPTVLRQVGIEPPEAMEGRPLQELLEGGLGRAHARSICFDRAANQAGREAGLIERPTWRIVSLRSPTTRFLYRDSPDHSSAYYDLALDPTETIEAPATSELLALLALQAKGVLDSMSDEDVARSAAELDEATRKRLEQLGYIND